MNFTLNSDGIFTKNDEFPTKNDELFKPHDFSAAPEELVLVVDGSIEGGSVRFIQTNVIFAIEKDDFMLTKC